MLITDIPRLRLQNQQIIRPQFTRPEDLVKYLGAVQSQDFIGAKWALGLRLNNSSDAEIEKAFNEGKILRTHALRPTWHFVTPQDLKWLTKLNEPQVKRIMNYYNKKLDLTDTLFNKSNTIIAKALKNKNFLTRTELAKIINESGIKASGQRLGHIVGWAELDLIICSGPKKGKQFTYALVDEVTPKTKDFSRDESLSKLAEIFFKTRGPATINDFAKWSGLSMADSRSGLNSVKSKLYSEIIEGKEYYFPASLQPVTDTLQPLLLPNYDEYISSYSDYSIISEPNHRTNLDKIGNAAFWNHIIINGMVVGSYRRTFTKDTILIELAPLRDLAKIEKDALENEAEKYGEFMNLTVKAKYL